MTKVIEALQSAKFLVDENGEQAVQISVSAWKTVLNWVEDQEDRAIVHAALPKLKRLREQTDTTDWVDWSDVSDSWDSD